MSLSDKDLIPLFVPGTICLPSPFPAIGELDILKDGAIYPEPTAPGTLLTVSHRTWPSTNISSAVVTWTIRVELVSAVLLTTGDELDCATATWVFTPSVPNLKSIAGGTAPKGIVFVPKEAPVLMRIELGTTASASAKYQLPGEKGCCDPCCDRRPFSFESVMGGPRPGEEICDPCCDRTPFPSRAL